MDILSQNEINRLKQDIKAKEYTIEAEKTIFEKKLKEKFGNEIFSSLENKHDQIDDTEERKKNLSWFLRTIKKMF